MVDVSWLTFLSVLRYAGTVMEVYKVNEELNSQLREVSQFTAQFSAEAGPRLSLPEHIRENCREIALAQQKGEADKQA